MITFRLRPVQMGNSDFAMSITHIFKEMKGFGLLVEVPTRRPLQIVAVCRDGNWSLSNKLDFLLPEHGGAVLDLLERKEYGLKLHSWILSCPVSLQIPILDGDGSEDPWNPGYYRNKHLPK